MAIDYGFYYDFNEGTGNPVDKVNDIEATLTNIVWENNKYNNWSEGIHIFPNTDNSVDVPPDAIYNISSLTELTFIAIGRFSNISTRVEFFRKQFNTNSTDESYVFSLNSSSGDGKVIALFHDSTKTPATFQHRMDMHTTNTDPITLTPDKITAIALRIDLVAKEAQVIVNQNVYDLVPYNNTGRTDSGADFDSFGGFRDNDNIPLIIRVTPITGQSSYGSCC